MNRDVILTCALTGAGDTAGRSPHVPVTPQQIAQSGLEAAAAGAAILHIHVRDPATGAPSRRLDLYREVVARIRAENRDVILNLTGGMGGDLTFGDDAPLPPGPGTDLVGPEERIEHILDLRPELCSLDCGSLNFGDTMYVTTPAYLRRMAGLIREAGVLPELEVFDTGHIRLARQLMHEGYIAEPPLFQLCLGIQWAAEASTRGMKSMQELLPENARWSAFGLGPMQMPMVAQSAILGGHVRVGLEDNLMLSRGVFATNAELVGNAVRLLELLGCRPLPPSEARERLGLAKRDPSRT